MKLKKYKRDEHFYSVEKKEGVQIAVFSMYKQAMKFVKNHKGGCR